MKMNTEQPRFEPVQLVWNGDQYEIADIMNSESPEWPVQDESARWHREQFDGQRVVYLRSEVHFGFMAIEIAEDDVTRDDDGELNFDGLFLTNTGHVYREA